jgi:hypothetical protein
MTLQEIERRRRQSERNLSDDQVLTFPQWCELNAISEPTGHRIKKKHPEYFIWLSDRRVGITVRSNREFQAARTGKAAE